MKIIIRNHNRFNYIASPFKRGRSNMLRTTNFFERRFGARPPVAKCECKGQGATILLASHPPSVWFDSHNAYKDAHKIDR